MWVFFYFEETLNSDQKWPVERIEVKDFEREVTDKVLKSASVVISRYGGCTAISRLRYP